MDFKYEQRSVPGPELATDENFEYNLEGCECEGGECRAANGCKCLAYGKDNYNSDGQLLHDEDSNLPIMECHPNCSCASECGNRSAQFSLQLRVEPFQTVDKGLGLRALEPIKQGCFVIEYSGEIVSREEAANRARQRSEEAPNQHNYIFTLREFTGGEATCDQTFIDATHQGNLSRIINHSCNPNLRPMILRYGRALQVLGLFAGRDISEGQELHYDYGRITDDVLQQQSSSQLLMKECKCGAENCRKFLPCCDYSIA